MPEGLDTVVPQEMVQHDQHATSLHVIRFKTAHLKAGNNRRLKGEDVAQGSVALHNGQRLNPAALGLMASLGLAQAVVFRRLKVAYFSTGDELLTLGEPPREGAVYDSNRYSVLGLLSRLGCEVLDLGVVQDDPVQLKAAFEQASAQADAIITSGGVSMGDVDFTRALMKELGDVAFWRIAMKPGRPMAMGRIGQAVWFGLPGNPVAVMVTFLALVRPALLKLMGLRSQDIGGPPMLKARSTEALSKKPGRTEYLRVCVTRSSDGQLQVTTTGLQGSGMLSSMVQANGLMVLAHHQGPVAVGDEVDVMMFEGVM
jgi:molybdopterin molybdotransferase